jgi:hypothetical protein
LVFCSGRAGRRGSNARARRNSPHTPLPPRPRFGGEKFLQQASDSFPCPSLPARKRLRNSLKSLTPYANYSM